LQACNLGVNGKKNVLCVHPRKVSEVRLQHQLRMRMEIVPFPLIAMISLEGPLMRELNLLCRRPLFRKIRTH
jgi:hypothetical protein